MRILIEGSIVGSYSLALLNREFSKALISLGHETYLTSIASPNAAQDPYVIAEPLLDGRVLSAEQVSSGKFTFDLFLHNDWPIAVAPEFKCLKAIHAFAWEETLLPEPLARRLEGYDAVSFMSVFCLLSGVNSGVTKSRNACSIGVDHVDCYASLPVERLDFLFDDNCFNFLHISSGLRRKGMDQGIDAFLNAFAGDQTTRLIIKTHRNVTNEMLVKIGSLSDEQRRQIFVIESDLSREQMKWLIEQSDAVFCPSKGEGFLLPAAEAMWLKTLVVVTDCGGASDFCRPQNAIVIPTSAQPATSHVGRSGSFWFDAQTADLETALVRARSATLSTRNTMIDEAKRDIAAFTWKRAATALLAAVVPSGASRNISDLVLISTFNQFCGISTYSESLASSFLKCGLSLLVMSESIEHYSTSRKDEPFVTRSWTREMGGTRNMALKLTKSYRAATIIIQHHPSIITWRELVGLGTALKSAEMNVLLEVHSTSGLTPSLNKELIERFSWIIVHSHKDYSDIVQQADNGRLALFPHPILPRSAVALARSDANESSSIRLMGFGKCAPHKNFEEIIYLVDLLRARGRDASATIVSAVDKADVSRMKYAHKLRWLSSSLGLSHVISFNFVFADLEDVEAQLSNSDLALYPYSDVREGASGAVRMALTAGVPVIASLSRVFDDLKDLDCQVSFDNLDEVANRACRLKDDKFYRQDQLERQREFLDFLTFEKHAARLLNLRVCRVS